MPFALFEDCFVQHDEFQADGNNDCVAKRIELVLRAYSQAGHCSATREMYCALAAATLLKGPTVAQDL